MRDRIRWWIAAQMNRLPGQCWTELVMFALRYKRSPWQPIDDACRQDAAAAGCCYCAKIGTPPVPGRSEP